jgi:hypothetical protein
MAIARTPQAFPVLDQVEQMAQFILISTRPDDMRHFAFDRFDFRAGRYTSALHQVRLGD